LKTSQLPQNGAASGSPKKEKRIYLAGLGRGDGTRERSDYCSGWIKILDSNLVGGGGVKIAGGAVRNKK